MSSDFRTEVEIQPFPFSIGYKTPTIFCGSCFTENIGSIMVERKLPVLVNPFGVVYNPVSVKLVLDRLLKATPLKEIDLNFRNGLWFSYLHHTSFSSPVKEKCLETINSELFKASEFAKSIKYLLVTFGTARVYYLNENNKPVANCHKTPSTEFTNRLLTVVEIVKQWTELVNDLLKQNTELKIIFTISPVRHWKDGAIGNQQSKAVLNLAVHEIIQLFPNNTFYFPSYEIMMDDLRDYRFYADDMLHPANAAIDYIWEKFKEALIEKQTKDTIKSIEKVLSAVNHRPFNPNTSEHKAFIVSTLELIKKIKSDNPQLDFKKEEDLLYEYLK